MHRVSVSIIKILPFPKIDATTLPAHLQTHTQQPKVPSRNQQYMHNYWCRHFILPKGVIKEINSICNRFFWKGTSTGKFNARVARNVICSPKSEGGLGLKDVIIYNNACACAEEFMEYFCKCRVSMGPGFTVMC